MQSLQPVAHRTLAETCADRLRRGIVDGSFVVGQRLPPEHQLATDLAVSRLTVRGALARLSAEGLLEVKHGSGYTVQDYREAGNASLLPELVLLAQEQGRAEPVIEDLLRMRRHLAGALFECLAVRPPSPESMAVVQSAIDRFRVLADDGASPLQFADADSDILAAVLSASGSAVLQLALNPVRAVMKAMPTLCAAMYREPVDNVDGWRVFAAWMANPVGDGAPALELLRQRDVATLHAWRNP